MLYFSGALMRRKQVYDEFKSFFCVWQKDRLHICLIMQYNGNEIYATRYMKSLFLFGLRWIGYFRLYLTGVRYFCMRSMVSVSLPSCLRYALYMFTAFETDLLCIWSINWMYSRKESLRFLVKSLSGLRQNMEWISSSSVMQLSSVDFKLDKKKSAIMSLLEICL